MELYVDLGAVGSCVVMRRGVREMRSARETARREREGWGTLERKTHEGADVPSGACLRPEWNSGLCWLEVSLQ